MTCGECEEEWWDEEGDESRTFWFSTLSCQNVTLGLGDERADGDKSDTPASAPLVDDGDTFATLADVAELEEHTDR